MTQWPNGPIPMTWFRKDNHPLEAPQEKRVQTEGLWTKCEACKHILWKKDLEANFLCCPKCGHHLKMGARQRLECCLTTAATRSTTPTWPPPIPSTSRTRRVTVTA